MRPAFCWSATRAWPSCGAGPRFAADGRFEQRLRLPFTQLPERLAEAVRRLAVTEDMLDPHSGMRAPTDRWIA